MRVVVLAGGLGTRLSEETEIRPKPMIEVGGLPILWHILKGYEACGLQHFVIALGYKGEVVKSFFIDRIRSVSDLTIDMCTGSVTQHAHPPESWVVDLVDTGSATNTGGRLARLREWLPDDTFCLTYGDGVSDVDVRKVIGFHRDPGRLATVTAVRPPARVGGLDLDGDEVRRFSEKPSDEGWINGGFMVLDRKVVDMIDGDDCNFESDVLPRLAGDGELMAYRHDGFWQCMDTLRDVRLLQSLWESDRAPWRTWT